MAEPLAALDWFTRAGAHWIHLVDMDRAYGRKENSAIIGAVLKAARVQVQVGGGLFRETDIDQVFTLGATRVVIGPRGAVDSGLVERLLARHGAERLAVGIDAKDGRVAPRGTSDVLDLTAREHAARVAGLGIRTIIYNEVTRDGKLTGPDVGGARQLAELGLAVIVSGGVGSLDDLRAARAAGLAGACVGRALYDEKVTIAEALALLLLLWNPASSRLLPSGDQPIVLLDASLSMSGAPWRAALDSARGFAHDRAVVWRFGSGVAAFDTAPPADGATRLGPALEAAAARAGEVVIVTDGAVDDAADIPADLLRRPRVITTPRPAFWDAYVARVEGGRHVTRSDTVRLRVSYGVVGMRDARSGMRTGRLTLRAEGRELMSQRVSLPDSGVLSQDLTLPASRIPHPGWTVLQIALDGVNDAEPRDDSRQFVVDVSLDPAAVIFASPPDWEARFLARTLADVARLPVRMFVETEPGRWRDGATLVPVASGDLTRAAQGARLVIALGDPARSRRAWSGAARRVPLSPWSAATGSAWRRSVPRGCGAGHSAAARRTKHTAASSRRWSTGCWGTGDGGRGSGWCRNLSKRRMDFPRCGAGWQPIRRGPSPLRCGATTRRASTRCASMPPAAPSCGCRPVSITMRSAAEPSAASSPSRPIPMNGCRARPRSPRSPVRRRLGWHRSDCATAGGCSSSRSLHWRRSGRCGVARACRNGAVEAAVAFPHAGRG